MECTLNANLELSLPTFQSHEKCAGVRHRLCEASERHKTCSPNVLFSSLPVCAMGGRKRDVHHDPRALRSRQLCSTSDVIYFDARLTAVTCPFHFLSATNGTVCNAAARQAIC